MHWWAAEPIIFTKDDFDGHRIRFLVAEKRARCSTRIIDAVNPAPEWLAMVNPDGIFPLLVDKNLVCHGPALDEWLHERYVAPPLLPNTPVQRAQVRMLTQRVTSWYSLPLRELTEQLKGVASCFPKTEFFAGPHISTIDIALAPLLQRVPWEMLAGDYPEFAAYRNRLLSRPTYKESLRAQRPVTNDLDDGFEAFGDGDDDVVSDSEASEASCGA